MTASLEIPAKRNYQWTLTVSQWSIPTHVKDHGFHVRIMCIKRVKQRAHPVEIAPFEPTIQSRRVMFILLPFIALNVQVRTSRIRKQRIYLFADTKNLLPVAEREPRRDESTDFYITL